MIIIKIILSLIFLAIASAGLFIGALAIWAKNYRLGVPSIIYGLLGVIEIYQTFAYSSPFIFWGILFIFLISGVLLWMYITEPDLKITDWFKSPETLIKEGRKEQAAIKYRRKGKWVEAAKLYEEIGWLTSAAICYEEAGKWEEVARIYEILADKEDYGEYYLRKAKEIYEEKLNNIEKAAEILEKLAEREEWYWDDAAELWEKAGNREKALKCWEKALDVYKKRAQEEDGVFWSDVAVIYEKLNEKEKAIEAYEKFLSYAIEMEEKEGKGWIRHVVETYYDLYRLTQDETYKQKAEEALAKYEEYLDDVVKDPDFRKKLIEEVKRHEKELVTPDL